MSFKSKCPVGASPIPARALANFCSRRPLRPSKKNWRTPESCINTPAAARRRRPRFVGFQRRHRPERSRQNRRSQNGVRIGSINPNLFQDQVYKFGSATSPESKRRAPKPNSHVQDCIEIGKATGSDLLRLWFADGTNYPGQDDIVARKRRMEEALESLARRDARTHDDAGGIQAV